MFLANGLSDPILSISNARQLVSMLREAGAEVDFREINAGHQLTSPELEAARDWVSWSLPGEKKAGSVG